MLLFILPFLYKACLVYQNSPKYSKHFDRRQFMDCRQTKHPFLLKLNIYHGQTLIYYSLWAFCVLHSIGYNHARRPLRSSSPLHWHGGGDRRVLGDRKRNGDLGGENKQVTERHHFLVHCVSGSGRHRCGSSCHPARHHH